MAVDGVRHREMTQNQAVKNSVWLRKGATFGDILTDCLTASAQWPEDIKAFIGNYRHPDGLGVPQWKMPAGVPPN